MLVGLWFSARCDLASAVPGWIWAENFIPKAMGRCPRALCNDPSAHPGGSVQSVTGHPHIRASPCSVQRGIRAFERGCAACSDPVGRTSGSLQSAVGHSFTGNGSLQRALGHPATGNALVFCDLLQRHAGVAFPKNTLRQVENPSLFGCFEKGLPEKQEYRNQGIPAPLSLLPAFLSDLFVSPAKMHGVFLVYVTRS